MASQPTQLADIGVAPNTPRSGTCAAFRPISARLEPVLDLRGFNHWFLHSYTFPSRLPDPSRLAVPARPVVVRAAPTLPRVSRLRLPSASTGCCDSPQVRPSHPHQVNGASWRTTGCQYTPVASIATCGDMVRLQPIAQPNEASHRRRELRHLLRARRVCCRHAYTRGHLGLVHIKPSDTLKNRLHLNPPSLDDDNDTSPARAPDTDESDGRAHSNSPESRGRPSRQTRATGSQAPSLNAASAGNKRSIAHFTRPRMPTQGQAN